MSNHLLPSQSGIQSCAFQKTFTAPVLSTATLSNPIDRIDFSKQFSLPGRMATQMVTSFLNNVGLRFNNNSKLLKKHNSTSAILAGTAEIDTNVIATTSSNCTTKAYISPKLKSKDLFILSRPPIVTHTLENNKFQSTHRQQEQKLIIIPSILSDENSVEIFKCNNNDNNIDSVSC